MENLYDDLENFDLGNEVQKLEVKNKLLQDHIKSLENDVEKLCGTVTQMKQVQKNLATNISELYKTAKAEIERKDRTIAELRDELDSAMIKMNSNRNVYPIDGRKRYRDNANMDNQNNSTFKRGNNRDSTERYDSSVDFKRRKYDDRSRSYKETERYRSPTSSYQGNNDRKGDGAHFRDRNRHDRRYSTDRERARNDEIADDRLKNTKTSHSSRSSVNRNESPGPSNSEITKSVIASNEIDIKEEQKQIIIDKKVSIVADKLVTNEQDVLKKEKSNNDCQESNNEPTNAIPVAIQNETVDIKKDKEKKMPGKKQIVKKDVNKKVKQLKEKPLAANIPMKEENVTDLKNEKKIDETVNAKANNIEKLLNKIGSGDNKSKTIKENEGNTVKLKNKPTVAEEKQKVIRHKRPKVTEAKSKENAVVEPVKQVVPEETPSTSTDRSVSEEKPLKNFKNLLPKKQQLSQSSIKSSSQSHGLHLTHEGEIPVLHIDDNNFIASSANNFDNDKNLINLMDVMNVTGSVLECDMPKFKNNNAENIKPPQKNNGTETVLSFENCLSNIAAASAPPNRKVKVEGGKPVPKRIKTIPPVTVGPSMSNNTQVTKSSCESDKVKDEKKDEKRPEATDKDIPTNNPQPMVSVVKEEQRLQLSTDTSSSANSKLNTVTCEIEKLSENRLKTLTVVPVATSTPIHVPLKSGNTDDGRSMVSKRLKSLNGGKSTIDVTNISSNNNSLPVQNTSLTTSVIKRRRCVMSFKN